MKARKIKALFNNIKAWFTKYINISLVVLVLALFSLILGLSITLTYSLSFCNIIDALKTSVTVLISMIGFSVSIYVFLNTTLQNRKNNNTIEKEVIQEFQNQKKKSLGKTIIFVSVAVIVELFILFCKDNFAKIIEDTENNGWSICTFLSITFCISCTLFTIIKLGVFAYQIINYDEGLKALARNLSADKPKSSYHQNMKKGEFLNLVNNIEVITERLIENHMHAKVSTVDESNLKRAICDGITNVGEIKNREQLADDYKRIIDYRNLILQDTSIEDSHDVAMGDEIKSVTNRLFKQYLNNELLTNVNINNLDIIDADLSKTSFSNSFLQKVDFKGTVILQNTDFRDSTLNNITFEKANCENINFTNSKLIDVKFNTNMNLTRSIFKYSDLSGINVLAPEDKEGPPLEFYNSVFTGANMGHIEIYNVCFNFSNLSKVRLTDSKIGSSAQKANNVTFKYADLTSSDLLSCKLERCNFENADLNGAILTYSEMSNVILTDARLNNATLSESLITTCHFNKTYCQNASFKGAIIRDTEFNYSTMNSVDLSNVEFYNVTFEDAVCRDALWVRTSIYNSSFSRCVLINSRIVGNNEHYSVVSNCNFSHANLSDSLITNVKFENCTFLGADLSNARLINVKFIDCEDLDTVCTNNLWLANVSYLGASERLIEPCNGWRYQYPCE